MMDRLVLLLLVGGCLLFGAILIMELAPAGAEDAVVAQAARSDAASPATRRQNPRSEELVATALARPLFSSTRRPPQDAPSGAAADADLTDARLTGIVTTPGHRIAIFAVSGDKPLKVAEGDAVSGWRIESITPREVSLSGPSRNQDLAAKARPKFSFAAWAAADRSTRRASANSAGSRQAARSCAGRGPSRRAAASRCPCQSGRATAASAAAPATVMSTPGRSVRPLALAVAVCVLADCQLPAQPGLEPLEQPSSLQAAEPRINSTIPTDRSRQRPFVASGAAAAPVVPPPGPGATATQSRRCNPKFCRHRHSGDRTHHSRDHTQPELHDRP